MVYVSSNSDGPQLDPSHQCTTCVRHSLRQSPTALYTQRMHLAGLRDHTGPMGCDAHLRKPRGQWRGAGAPSSGGWRSMHAEAQSDAEGEEVLDTRYGIVLTFLTLALMRGAFAVGLVLTVEVALCMFVIAMRCARRWAMGAGRQRVAWGATRIGGSRRSRRMKVVTGADYILIAGRADGGLRLNSRYGLRVAAVRRGGILVLAVRGRAWRLGAARTVARLVLVTALVAQSCVSAALPRRIGGMTLAEACAGSHAHSVSGRRHHLGPHMVMA